MESVGPSDYVCLNCNLRFKNSKSYENHKRKFCQAQGGGNKSPVRDSGGYHGQLNVQTEFPLKTAASSVDFWKPSGSRNGLTSQGRYEGFVFGVNGNSQNFGNLNKISADMKFNSVLDDLKIEHEKLEEHKRAIQMKLAGMHQNGRSEMPISAARKQRSQEAFNEARRDRNIAMETHLDELRNSLLRDRNSPAPSFAKVSVPHRKRWNGGSISKRANFFGRNGRKKYSLHPSSAGYGNENMLLAHLRKLKRQYIEEGGDDTRIFEMMHGLETEVYNRRPRSENRESDMIIHQLQQQLAVVQQTNASLMKEIDILKSNREYQRERTSSQSNGYELVKRDFASLHERKLMEMKQEAEIYRQQLELERLRGELQQYRGGFSNLPQLPAIPQDQKHHSLVMSDRDMYQVSNEKTEEAFQQSPYDPGNGFAIFWDFVCGIDQAASRCRISVTMFKGSEPVSDTKVLPAVSCNPANANMNPASRYAGRIAILGIKQIFPRCLPLQSLTVVVQVEMGGQSDISYEMLQEAGWTQVEIFDSFSRVIAGRWKIPIRIPPVAPHLTATQLNAIQQLDGCELYYRLINARDIDSQEGIVLSTQQTRSYKYPPLEHKLLQFADVSLEPTRAVISRADSPKLRRSSPRKESGRHAKKSEIMSPISTRSQSITSPFPVHESPSKEPSPKPVNPSPAKPQPVPSPKEPTPAPEPSPQQQLQELPSNDDDAVEKYFMGFQIDKLYNSQEATARLQITIFGGNGKIIKAGDILATNRSLYCRSPFLKSVIAFALEEIHFTDLILDRKSFAIIEVYTTAAGGFMTLTQTDENEEQLICWNFIRLCDTESSFANQSTISRLSAQQDADEDNILKINSGRQEVFLYSPPVLDPRQILASFKDQQYLKNCQQFGNAFISFYTFDDKTVPLSLPMDIPIFKDEEQPPENAWISGKRTVTPTTLFKNGDGFELYIDAARCLPDNCAFVKVVCQLYDNKYTKLKEEFESDLNLDLDPYNPQFDHKFEFRDYTYPATTTILFKIFMVDTLTKQASWFGVSVLPIFVKQNTFDRADDTDSQFCLNQGNFQLKLYNQLKNLDRLTRNSVEGPIPCASLLVRLLPAPCHADGQPKQAAEFLEDQWESEGLMIRKPDYTADERNIACVMNLLGLPFVGTYDTTECQPNVMECRLFHAFMKRNSTTSRESMKLIIEGRKSKNDQGLVDSIKSLMKNINNLPKADLTYLSKYNSMHGVVFSVDAAQNLPWTGFTFASYCFSPPASFYKGKLDDPAVLVTKLDLDGYIRLPKWNDGMKVFPRRRSHTHLVVLIHLYELKIVPQEDNIVFALGAQAWTLIPVCAQEFPNHGQYQVGLFHDTPTDAIIDAIQNEPIVQTIGNLRKRKQVKVVDGASIFVRVGDARRREELEDIAKLPVKKTFLPRGNKFLNPVQSKRFSTIIPSDQNTEEYGKILGSKFRMLAGQAFQQRIPR